MADSLTTRTKPWNVDGVKKDSITATTKRGMSDVNQASSTMLLVMFVNIVLMEKFQMLRGHGKCQSNSCQPRQQADWQHTECELRAKGKYNEATASSCKQWPHG
jgi:hypothetical protein